MTKCPFCGRDVTVKPSGAILHNHSGRAQCDEPLEQGHDWTDRMSSIWQSGSEH